jgi:transposase-like protein
MTISGRRRRWVAEEKAEHVALCAKSGLSQRAYCQGVGISAATFSAWYRRARAGARHPAKARAGFAEVRVRRAGPSVTAASVGAAVAIHLPGTRLDVPVGIDPVWLGQVVKSLRATGA